jgi:hypothetical protein
MVALKDVHHGVVGGGANIVCHWPRQGGIWHWGDEILVGYIESPCEYKNREEVGHGQKGIWRRGYVRLRRSLDKGETWVDAGKVFDNSLPVEEQQRVLHLDDYRMDAYGRSVGPPRAAMDMTSPDAVFLMGRAWCGSESRAEDGAIVRGNVVYAFRSTDRGRSWEKIPSILWPNHTRTLVELANNTLKTDDGRWICWLVGTEGIEGVSKSRMYSAQLYASENHGETWEFYSEIYGDPTHRIAASYPHIVVLPSGRWLGFLGCWFQSGGARVRWTSLCVSDDQGLNWSEPRRIHSWSISPFPVLLRDGRLVVFFMRRVPDPTGLYAIVSEDEGVHWSKPLCIRDDTIPAGPRGGIDGGYPVAFEMDDGRLFTAYYWQHDDADVPWHGGRKFIAGTSFRLD